jgi:hypothetical protein
MSTITSNGPLAVLNGKTGERDDLLAQARGYLIEQKLGRGGAAFEPDGSVVVYVTEDDFVHRRNPVATISP